MIFRGKDSSTSGPAHLTPSPITGVLCAREGVGVGCDHEEGVSNGPWSTSSDIYMDLPLHIGYLPFPLNSEVDHGLYLAVGSVSS